MRGTRTDASTPPTRSGSEEKLVDAFQHLVGEVFRLNGQLLGTAERLARSLHVSPARWQTIAIIRNEPMTVAEISRRIGIRRQSAQHNVNLLLEQGFVELHPNPGHRRAGLVTLSPSGIALMKELHGLQRQLTAIFNAELQLTAARIDELTQVLADMRLSAEYHEEAVRRKLRRPAG
jgi:DNA-binding MarR family transcriptional regulator